VTRQSWQDESKTLVLDYFHGPQDKVIIVDNLEIVIIPRARAYGSLTHQLVESTVTVSSDAHITGIMMDTNAMTITADCTEGAAVFSAVLDRKPSSVVLDGQLVPFVFTSPQRVLSVPVTTMPFSESQRPTSPWQKLSRSVLGPPPGLEVVFERARFYPVALADGKETLEYTKVEFNDRRWYRVAFGPWRQQSTDLTQFGGVGWYRLDCKLPRSYAWEIPYYLELSTIGKGTVYFNGVALAQLPEKGEYRLPLPAWLVRENDKNIFALVLLGSSPDAGLYRAELAADMNNMTQRRTLVVKF
jgi:hypothetical protein